MLLQCLRCGPRRLVLVARVSATAGFVVGGLLIVWSSYIHFRLWQAVGYRHIPTIGPLFLVQSIAGFVLGLLVIAVRRVWTAVLGVGFAGSTLVALLISVHHGLFGFKDTWAAPYAHLAFVIEILTIATLILAGTLCVSAPKSSSTASRP